MDYNIDLKDCGKILKNQTQYLLRCGDCNGDFYNFEDFVIHHSERHSLQDKNDERPGKDDDECEIKYSKQEHFIPQHNEEEVITMRTRQMTKQQCTEDVFKGIDDTKSNDDKEFLKIEPMMFVEVEQAKEDESDESDEDENEDDENEFKGEDIKCKKFVSEFLASEENYITFIEAYKKQPQLWNYKLYPVLCTQKDRAIYFIEIEKEIQERLNVQMSHEYVRATISSIRIRYREKSKKLAARKEKKGESSVLKSVPTWYFEKLQFLEPFLSKESIFKLDPELPDMTQEQVIKIIHMYKKLPNLWNTNLLEIYCKNKREECLKQLAKEIHAEVGLEVSEFSLQRYLNELQKSFYNEKAEVLRNKADPQTTQSVYYKEMAFLDDHVGPFKCSQCACKYRGPLQLKVHTFQKHNGKRLSCPECGKEYELLVPYITHARRHMNDMSVKCPQCDKMFLRQGYMKVHLRTHTGDRPYSCEICGASFSNATAIREHRERHSKEFQFFCPICSKGFYSKKNMKKHILIHSDVKKYPCNICGKAFRTRIAMRSHETSHEKGRKYPCPKCGNMYKNENSVAQHIRKSHRELVKTNPFINDHVEEAEAKI